MRRTCEDCGQGYDDARQWTLCPHMPLEGPSRPRDEDPAAGYCREHDLFGCPFHDDSPHPTDLYGVADTRRVAGGRLPAGAAELDCPTCGVRVTVVLEDLELHVPEAEAPLDLGEALAPFGDGAVVTGAAELVAWTGRPCGHRHEGGLEWTAEGGWTHRPNRALQDLGPAEYRRSGIAALGDPWED